MKNRAIKSILGIVSQSVIIIRATYNEGKGFNVGNILAYQLSRSVNKTFVHLAVQLRLEQ